MKKRLMALMIGLNIALFTGCSMPVEHATKETKITEPPQVHVIDVLSSVQNEFKVKSGNFAWYYVDGDERVSLSASGPHPLDLAQVEEEKLEVTSYNQEEYTSYQFSSIVSPDQLVVHEWDVSEMGNIEADMLSTTTYTEAFIVEFKPGRVYELIATWDEENLDENGFYGEASYVVVTEEALKLE